MAELLFVCLWWEVGEMMMMMMDGPRGDVLGKSSVKSAQGGARSVSIGSTMPVDVYYDYDDEVTCG